MGYWWNGYGTFNQGAFLRLLSRDDAMIPYLWVLMFFVVVALFVIAAGYFDQ